MAQLIRYRVTPQFVAENEALIRSVFEELHEAGPAGLRYQAFVEDDGTSFAHVVDHLGDGTPNPLVELAAFQRFLEGLAERCDIQPERVSVRQNGSYGHAWPESVAERATA